MPLLDTDPVVELSRGHRTEILCWRSVRYRWILLLPWLRSKREWVFRLRLPGDTLDTVPVVVLGSQGEFLLSDTDLAIRTQPVENLHPKRG
jgi:hypothetical protein